MKKPGKLFSIILAAMILMTQVSVVFAQTADYSKNWAGKEIKKWLSYGIIQTYKDGNFKPSAPITRIDMAIMLNKLFNYQEKAVVQFSDVAAGASYEADVETAAASGNFSGSNGKFRPDDTITRQEAAVVFARAFSLTDTGKNNLAKFKDADKIASWSRDAVNMMVNSRYMNGVPGDLFAPGVSITRAEAVNILDNMVKGLKNKAGSYTGDVSGSLIVNTKDIKLENMIVKGDLYLSEGIGNGEVTLNNVKVTGRTIVKGGGEHSIILNNSSVSGGLIVMKKDGKVRVVASGSSIINNVTLSSGAKLEESNLTGNGFENVEIIQLAPGQQATLDGDFASLSIETDSVMANIPDGKVGTVKIKEGTNGSKLVVGSAASVSNLIADDDVTVTGGSRIKTAKINSNGAVLDTKPESISIAPNITAKVAGVSATSEAAKPVTPASSPAAAAALPAPMPAAGGGSGSGGNSGNSGTPTPAIALSAADITTFSGRTTSSSVTVSPSDATLVYSSSKPSVVSVNTATGVLTGVSTGSAVITVTASKTGYSGATTTFNVTVLEDTLVVYNPPCFKPEDVKAIASDKVEITYNQEIAYAEPGAFRISTDGTPDSVSALVTAAAIDGRKVTLTLDRSIGTATDKAYLYQVNNTLVRNADGQASTTFSAFRLVDKISPTITVSSTNAGIIIEFSEDIIIPGGITTTAAFQNSVLLTKNGQYIRFNNISRIDARRFKIGGLDEYGIYKIMLYPRNMTDISGNLVAYSGETTVKTGGTDTVVPTVTSTYSVYNVGYNEGYNADEDVVVFHFSEAMDDTTVLDLNNYTVSTPGSILTTKQALALYNDVSSMGMTSDGKEVTLKIKGISMSNGNEVFTLHDMKDLAGNIMPASTVERGAPTAVPTYTVTDEDVVVFRFSEAMDPAAAADLNNYTVSAPGSILMTKQVLTLYNDVSFIRISSDGKQVTLKIKGISTSNGNEVFTLHDLKSLAGKTMPASTVEKFRIIPLSFLPSDAIAISENQVEITYNKEIRNASPYAFRISADGTVSTVYAYVYSLSVDGKKLTLTLDRKIGTATDKAFLYQADNTLVTDEWGVASATFSAFRLVDKIQPMVTFSSTNAGIVITFSEDVVTTVSGLAAEITLTKGENKVETFGAASITSVDAHTYMVGGLDANTEYKIQMVPKTTVDLCGNSFRATGLTTVKTNGD